VKVGHDKALQSVEVDVRHHEPRFDFLWTSCAVALVIPECGDQEDEGGNECYHVHSAEKESKVSQIIGSGTSGLTYRIIQNILSFSL